MIGRPYFWVERRLWSDEQLKAHLVNDKIALYVLYLGGVPAGMAELDFREKGIAHMAYFGLTPEFTGRRIGPWLLYQMVELAWAEGVEKMLLNTCTLDHRKALCHLSARGLRPLCALRAVGYPARGFPDE